MYSGTKGNPDTNFDENRLSRGDPFRAFEGLRTWERGIVRSVDTVSYTCDVHTERGKLLTSLPWPATHSSTDGVSGEIAAPKELQDVIVYYNLGEPRLLPAPLNVITSTEGPDISISNAGRPSGVDGLSSNRPDFRGQKPRDIIPGDWVRLGTMGNMVGVLEGGISLLRASPTSQVIASTVDDTVRVISRNMHLLSDFGEVKFVNDNGKVNFSMRGGAHQTEETSPHAGENFTFAADIGIKGDLVNVDISDPRGVIAYRNHIDVAGNQDVITGHQDVRATGDIVTVSEKSVSLSADGDYTRRIGGSATTTTGGSSEETTQGHKSILSGQTMNVAAATKMSLSGGSGVSIASLGPATAAAGDTSLDIHVTNGDTKFSIGDPKSGDLLKAKSGFIVSTTNGDIDFSTKLGKCHIDSKLPDSIVLGGKSGSFHAVLFEKLKAFLDAYGNLVDTHVHPTIGGPSGPPVPTPYSMSKSLLPLAKSTVVVIPK